MHTSERAHYYEKVKFVLGADLVLYSYRNDSRDRICGSPLRGLP